MQIFPDAPEFAEADGPALEAYIAETQAQVDAVAANPAEFVSADVTLDSLLELTSAAVENVKAAKDALAALQPEPVDVPAETADRFAALAAEATEPAPEPEPAAAVEAPVEPEPEALAAETAEPEPEPEPEPVDEPEAVTAAAPAVQQRRPAASLPAPSRSRASVPAAQTDGGRMPVSLTAAAAGLGPTVGDRIDALQVARMMVERRRNFGQIGKDTSGEKITIAKFDWDYPEGRALGGDPVDNMAIVASVVNDRQIREEFERRRDGSLVAAGGLCAPLTPYYDLADVTTSGRPVRDALPGFNADRGGIRYARPALLTAIDTAVGRITADDDAAGGTFATKACQVVDCPPFQDTEIAAIYHCLQIGNMTARTYPELLAQWNNLLLAAQARLADSQLLTDIGDFSTSVTAASSGLGATGDLLEQMVRAAAAMRSRHRMSDTQVIRVMLPAWAMDVLVTDVMRSQFERFASNTEAVLTAWLRQFNIEPSYYIDGAAGAGQVFDAQTAGTLDAWPTTVVWYMFPEGAFLFLDGGTLELGLVRDSILNSTNDYQLFGETFENVAFVGVESLEVTSTLSQPIPTGATGAPVAI